MFEVGEVLICKKSLKNTFKCGKHYRIDCVGANFDNFYINHFRFSYSGFGNKFKWFDYFYTKKELRKLKLEKLAIF